MVRGRSRYLDGSEAKVKEVTSEHSTSFDKGISAARTIREHRLYFCFGVARSNNFEIHRAVQLHLA